MSVNNAIFYELLQEIESDKMEFSIQCMIMDFKEPEYLYKLINFRHLLRLLGKKVNGIFKIDNDLYKEIVYDEYWNELSIVYTDLGVEVNNIEKFICLIEERIGKLKNL